MKTNPNAPSMPTTETGNNGETIQGFGLTKREHFAGLAMQGLLAGYPNYMPHEKEIAIAAVQMADALIVELNKEVAP